MRTTKETKYLRYDFDNAEKLVMGNTLATNHNRLADLKAEEAVFKAQMKDKLATIELSIQGLSRCLYTGYEMRNIECAVRWDSPNVNEVEYVRMDTGEVAITRAMTESERQQELEFTKAVEVAAADGKESAENIEAFFGEGSIDAMTAKDAGNSAQEEEDEEDVNGDNDHEELLNEDDDAVFSNPDPAAASEAIKPEHDAAWEATGEQPVKPKRGRPAGSKNKVVEDSEPF